MLATNTPSSQQASWAANIDFERIIRWVGYAAVAAFFVWLLPQVGDNPRGYIQATISGFLTGGIYALVAVGIVMINKASGVFNFAHGAMMLITSLVFYSFFTTSTADYNIFVIVALVVSTVVMFLAMNSWRDLLNPVSLGIGAVASVVLIGLMYVGGDSWTLIHALVGSITTAILIGLMIERFSIRPLVGQPIFTLILMTLALDRIFYGLSIMVWGSIDKSLNLFGGILDQSGAVENPAWKLPRTIRVDVSPFLDESARLTNINLDSRLVIAFGIAILIFAAFVLFFQKTNVGLAMRATSENQVLAQSVGMRVRAILAAAWGIATLLALAAGVLYGGAAQIGTGMPGLVFLAFPAVLLGGLESISGALIGGLIIGIVQLWADTLLPGTQAGTQLAPYVILMIVLVIRPDGLFGQKRIERI